MAYVESADKSGDECIFCAHLKESDEDALILTRAERAFVLMNAFPYNTGHLMVAPVRHVGDLVDLSDEERNDLMALTVRSEAALRKAMRPDGFNVGVNLGRVAGAGVPGHVHVHVVPRWGGDTNFMTSVGDAKVLPEALQDTYKKLRAHF
ncbi:MAG: HIT domain-containing protein [Actinomycetota bacterium]|nr:HIT domain-containing protein [Actinomycetota bacterium]